MGIPVEFENLLCTSGVNVDATIGILPLEQPVSLAVEPVFSDQEKDIYQLPDGQWRIYALRSEQNGPRVCCYFGNDGKIQLYYPLQLWSYYTQPIHCSHLIGLERILLGSKGFLIHSSVVEYLGKTILFAGPSGIGKSTQANLWERYLGARVLNGDWCVVTERDGMFYGGGSLCAGYSEIYCEAQAPIAGIVLLEQGAKNQLCVPGARAVSGLLSQITVNAWDASFMEELMDRLQRLMERVPVYRLCCRPDRESVELVRCSLFR